MKRHTPGGILIILLLLLDAGCRTPTDERTVYGVSRTLAELRSRNIHNLRYNIRFVIPPSADEPVTGEEYLIFSLEGTKDPLILDFRTSGSSVQEVELNGTTVPWNYLNGHIIIPRNSLTRGDQQLRIRFIAGDLSLNRNPDFLYTLLVPDRASTVFPCFDQPDLKAEFTLTLEIPASWTGCSNGMLKEETLSGNRKTMSFSPTKEIPTYLFAFVAGRFEKMEKEMNGRKLIMYHRENDQQKVSYNAGDIFSLHLHALEWLEGYTGIAYPFDSFAFILIPAFQYNGMEHPGAIYYRASSLMLEPNATQQEKLRRASLIAHETAHMWFGDLVTMKWFDDVWLKEVFAGFMADKIVNPGFPLINHDLLFFLGHYPLAYEIDRTAAPNAIAQHLNNLTDAGSLYGNIIYHKAPIVIRMLEDLIGEIALQQGLREYLHRFSYSNATWDNLIAILDSCSETNLRTWEAAWIKEAGMPAFSFHINQEPDGTHTLNLIPSDIQGKGRGWPQPLTVVVNDGSRDMYLPLTAGSDPLYIPTGMKNQPAYILPDSSCRAYGYFRLDSASLKYFLKHMPDNDLQRGCCWVNLWENMLQGDLRPIHLLNAIMAGLPHEHNQQITNQLLNYLSLLYWKFLQPGQREAVSGPLEDLLWEGAVGSNQSGMNIEFLRYYARIALTPEGINNLGRLWNRKRLPEQPVLYENDEIMLAQELAVRGVAGYEQILDEQLLRISNPDRRKEMAFIIPALSADKTVRDRFFNSLRDKKNREHEPWVLSALQYLHHPLRAAEAIDYIRPSLDMLEEIRATGDIFFPKRWLEASFWGHQEPRAVEAVKQFLDEHPDYPRDLKEKIVQSADLTERAVKILGQPAKDE